MAEDLTDNWWNGKDEKGEKVEVSEDDIRELEEQYESMIYEKEENQIQQESD